MMQYRFKILLLVALVILSGLAVRSIAVAQSAPSLSNDALLSLLMPQLPDGTRPGVHLWARADQASGPGSLPTSFLATLYTKQTASGPEEHEIVNYAQYSGGTWTPARAVNDGTLLTDDWAWISLNLVNLSATATGSGDNSTYIVDYEANGNYNGSPRDLQIEETYGPDLSLLSTSVLQDSAGLLSTSGLPASSAQATSTPSTTATAPPAALATTTPATTTAATASATRAATLSATAAPARTAAPSASPSPTPTPVGLIVPAATPAAGFLTQPYTTAGVTNAGPQSAPNRIIVGSTTSDSGAVGISPNLP